MNQALIDKIEPKFDSLTGVYERFAIEGLVRLLLSENHPFTLLLIDGDNFKNVNDGYGHKVGDLVIKTISERIKSAFENIGFVGRFGGDEFIVVMPDIVEYDDVWSVCHDLHAKFVGFSVPDYPSIFITITVGLSPPPVDGSDYDELFAKADKALYRGKQKGRNCFIIYLNEKHSGIKILSGDSPTENSMQHHKTIFKLLAKSDKLNESIPYLLQFFTTTLMIDHVAVQGRNELLFSEVYSLSKVKEFSYIDNSLISVNISPDTGIFYINEVEQLSKRNQCALVDLIAKQQIFSTLYAEISYGGIFYGYLRADTTVTFRIWQRRDMNLLLTAANAIAMQLYFQSKTLEDFIESTPQKQ